MDQDTVSVSSQRIQVPIRERKNTEDGLVYGLTVCWASRQHLERPDLRSWKQIGLTWEAVNPMGHASIMLKPMTH